MHRSIPLDRFDDVPDTAQGLTAQAVAARSARYGQNQILEAAAGGWVALLRDTVKDPMLWFLVATSGLFGIVGEWTESAVLLAALVPFLGMDAYLNRRTQASTEGLSTRLATQATVERDGRRQAIASLAVVPGDLVVIDAGDAFPADGLLVQGERMQTDESSLTGEAFPVRKEALARFPRAEAQASVESRHWGYAGTRLLTGAGLLRVV